MKAVEILLSPSVGNYFAKMEDGSYRWVADDMRLLPGGPIKAWVERGRTAAAASLHGEPNVQRVQWCHSQFLARLNENIAKSCDAE